MRYGLLLFLAALPLTACGASLDPVAKAASKASAKGTEHVTLKGTVVSPTGIVQMNGSGDFDNAKRVGRAHFGMTLAGKAIAVDEIIAGSTIYMRSPLFTKLLAGGKTWLSVNLAQTGKKLGVNLGQFSQSPTDTLAVLRKNAAVSKVGTETVDGVSTTHYRATLDPQKNPDLERLMHVSKARWEPVQVWIDDEGLPRRILMSYSVAANGKTVGTTMQTDFSSFGKPVTVQAPPKSETFDMTKLGG